MLARPLPTTARATPSGCVGTVAVSPIVTVQPAPSASRLASCGRASRMRTIAAPSWPRSKVALRIAGLVSGVSAATSILAALSNTSHSTSARRNTAAGVGTANGNSTRNVVPDRLATATTVPSGLGAGRFGSEAAATGAGVGADCSRPDHRRHVRQRRRQRVGRIFGGFRRYRCQCGWRCWRSRRLGSLADRRRRRLGRRISRGPILGWNRFRRLDRRDCLRRGGLLHGRLCRGALLRHRGGRLLGLLRLGAIAADVDHDAAILAEIAHFRRAIEREGDGGRSEFGLGFDRLQSRRQRRLGVRQVPFDLLIEIEREFAVGAFRRDVGVVRHFEYVAGESWLARDLDPDQRRLLQFFGQALLCNCRSASRKRRESSSTTSCGRPGMIPVQLSGNRST